MWKVVTLQAELKFDNSKLRLKSSIFKCISWLYGSFFGGENRGFLKEGAKTYIMAPLTPLNSPTCFLWLLSSHLWLALWSDWPIILGGGAALRWPSPRPLVVAAKDRSGQLCNSVSHGARRPPGHRLPRHRLPRSLPPRRPGQRHRWLNTKKTHPQTRIKVSFQRKTNLLVFSPHKHTLKRTPKRSENQHWRILTRLFAEQETRGLAQVLLWELVLVCFCFSLLFFLECPTNRFFVHFERGSPAIHKAFRALLVIWSLPSTMTSCWLFDLWKDLLFF